MKNEAVESLELRALQQRNDLHQTAAELRTKITAAREKLNVARNARLHFAGTAAVVTSLGLLSGYALTGLFTEN